MILMEMSQPQKPLRSLIVTTGEESMIMDHYLPSLRNNANYRGDLLIVDYEADTAFDPRKGKCPIKPFSQQAIEQLEEDGVFYRCVHKKYDALQTDRFCAFYECLKPFWPNYDVVMVSDADIVFFSDILPFLDMAKKELCATKNLWCNNGSYLCHLNFPREWVEKIGVERCVDMALIAGPPQKIKGLFEFILETAEKHDYRYGADQEALNVWHYVLGNSIHFVDAQWLIGTFTEYGNYLTFTFKVKNCEVIDNKTRVALEEKVKCRIRTFEGEDLDVAILHAKPGEGACAVFPKLLVWPGLVTTNDLVSLSFLFVGTKNSKLARATMEQAHAFDSETVRIETADMVFWGKLITPNHAAGG